ncbi:MAG: thiamine pyrophosphate-binding protein [Planctomycetes bacterium]|nr:thiamine pyrophosphate-binding protein [Planctomycetota bacterium]
MQPLEAQAPTPPPTVGRAADVVARALRSAGVRQAFGVPGGETLRLIESLGEAGIPFRLARHENAAGYMAIGAQRAGESLGLLVATLGPGVANAIGPAAHALQDDVPLVILGGRVALDSAPEFRHQVIDQQALFRPVTKAVFELRAERAAEIIGAAIATALAEPRGSVYVDCPLDEVEKTCAGDREASPARTTPPSADLEPLVAALDRSRRPLLLLGLGALRPGVAPVVAALLERRPMPVLTSYKAKGIVPESHPLALGGAGLSPLADEMLLPFVGRADLVLLAGYDPVEMRSNWNRPFAATAEVSSLGIAAARRAGPVAKTAIEAPLVPILRGLTDRCRATPLAEDLEEEIETLRARLEKAFAPRGAWEPAVLFDLVREGIGAEDLVTVDTGAHRILLTQRWRLEQPGRLLQSSGFCSMACALPMAIGALLAAPERRVVALLGDGGLEMAVGELATLRDLRLPLTLVVVDDGGYALIDLKQRARGFAPAGVAFGRSDYVQLAHAFGGRGHLVTDAASARAALVAAGTADEGFDLIHAVFPGRSYDGRI